MAFVKWMTGIEFVSGALKKINKKSAHAKDQTMLLATHRTAPTANTDGCTKLYARQYENVFTDKEPSADTLARRERFGAVSRLAQARKRNLSTIASDKAAFEAQKDTTGGYPTLYKYLWHVCAAQYDQNNG